MSIHLLTFLFFIVMQTQINEQRLKKANEKTVRMIAPVSK